MSETKVYVSRSLIEAAKQASRHDDDVEVLRTALKSFELSLMVWGKGGDIHAMKGRARQLIRPESLHTILDDSAIPLHSANHGFLARLFSGYTMTQDDYGLLMPNDLFKHITERVSMLKADRTVEVGDKHAPHYAAAYINASMRCFTKFSKHENDGFKIHLVEKGSDTPKPLFQ